MMSVVELLANKPVTSFLMRHIVLICLSLAMCTAQASPPLKVKDTDQLKAAFVFRILQFVKWPDEPESDHANKSPIRLCFWHQNSLSEAALKNIKSVTVRRRPLHIIRDVNSYDMTSCHVLYIPARSWQTFDDLNSVLRKLDRQATLTIGDKRNFAEYGGMINLLRRQDRLAIKVNFQEVRNAKLQIGSPLLELAKIVQTQKP